VNTLLLWQFGQEFVDEERAWADLLAHIAHQFDIFERVESTSEVTFPVFGLRV